MHDLTLALEPEAGDVSDVNGIATALVIQCADQGIQIPGLRLDLTGNREVRGLIERVIPTGSANGLCRDRKRSGIGVLRRPIEHVVRGGENLAFADAEVARI